MVVGQQVLTGDVAFPLTGSMALTGVVPNYALTVTPAVHALGMSGFAPTISRGFFIDPATGAVLFAGAAPALFQVNYTTPTVGSLVLVGAAPSAFGTFSVNPGTGTLIFTGDIPIVIAPRHAFPLTGMLVNTGIKAVRVQKPLWFAVNDTQVPIWVPVDKEE
jgi:hypothetical protein